MTAIQIIMAVVVIAGLVYYVSRVKRLWYHYYTTGEDPK